MKKRSKKYVDIDDMTAGDDIDGRVAQSLYGNIHNATWFVQDKGKMRYFGPRFSCRIVDAIDVLNYYMKNYGHLISSYCLLEHTEKGPYACTAELRRIGSNLIIRSWGPTLPLAISRLMLKAPKK